MPFKPILTVNLEIISINKTCGIFQYNDTNGVFYRLISVLQGSWNDNIVVDLYSLNVVNRDFASIFSAERHSHPLCFPGDRKSLVLLDNLTYIM